MRTLILSLKEKGINTYYTDTDSIFTDAPLPAELVSNTAVGALKLEAGIKEAFFVDTKLYAFVDHNNEYTFKTKGFKISQIEETKNKTPEETFNFFKSLMYKDVTALTTKTNNPFMIDYAALFIHSTAISTKIYTPLYKKRELQRLSPIKLPLPLPQPPKTFLESLWGISRAIAAHFW